MLALLLACSAPRAAYLPKPAPEPRIVEGSGPLSWSPDGKSLAVGTEGGAWILDREGQRLGFVDLGTTPVGLSLTRRELAWIDGHDAGIVELGSGEELYRADLGYDRGLQSLGREHVVVATGRSFQQCGNDPNLRHLQVKTLRHDQREDRESAWIAEQKARPLLEAQPGGGVRLQDLEGRISGWSLPGHEVDQLELSPDGRIAAWTSQQGVLVLMPVVEGRLPEEPRWGEVLGEKQLEVGTARLHEDYTLRIEHEEGAMVLRARAGGWHELEWRPLGLVNQGRDGEQLLYTLQKDADWIAELRELAFTKGYEPEVMGR